MGAPEHALSQSPQPSLCLLQFLLCNSMGVSARIRDSAALCAAALTHVALPNVTTRSGHLCSVAFFQGSVRDYSNRTQLTGVGVQNCPRRCLFTTALTLE